MRTLILCLALTTSLTACGAAGEAIADQRYTVTKVGMQEVSDRNESTYTNTLTFTANQKYKFENKSGFKEPHFLIMKVTKFSGETVLEDTIETMIFIEDGQATENCQNYFYISKGEEKSLAPITCKFELLGVQTLDAKATLQAAQPSK